MILIIHSWLRWFILILAIVILVKSVIGMSGNRNYSKGDSAIISVFVGLLDSQLLIGLILYFWISPITSNAWVGDVFPIKNTSIRYWAIEHSSMMIIAIVLAHIGKAKTKKLLNSAKKFKTQFIYFGIVLLLILSRIPWNESERLFRF